MVTNNNMQSNSGNLFVASTVALLFVLVAAAIVWVAQIRPSSARPSAAEAPPAAEQPAVAPAQTEQTPAQTSKGDAAAGQTAFASTCSACHGPGGEGIQGLGKDLTTSEFVAGQTDDQLVGFIKVGRGPTDPGNTTGIAMPPKGGNPALSDDDLYNIVAYIRSIHKK